MATALLPVAMGGTGRGFDMAAGGAGRLTRSALCTGAAADVGGARGFGGSELLLVVEFWLFWSPEGVDEFSGSCKAVPLSRGLGRP